MTRPAPLSHADARPLAPAAVPHSSAPSTSAKGERAGNCPDCAGPLDSRFYDHEAQISYPCDDGEHYCASCDAIWTDECLRATPDQAMIAEALHRHAMNAQVRL